MGQSGVPIRAYSLIQSLENPQPPGLDGSASSSCPVLHWGGGAAGPEVADTASPRVGLNERSEKEKQQKLSKRLSAASGSESVLSVTVAEMWRQKPSSPRTWGGDSHR